MTILEIVLGVALFGLIWFRVLRVRVFAGHDDLVSESTRAWAAHEKWRELEALRWRSTPSRGEADYWWLPEGSTTARVRAVGRAR